MRQGILFRRWWRKGWKKMSIFKGQLRRPIKTLYFKIDHSF